MHLSRTWREGDEIVSACGCRWKIGEPDPRPENEAERVAVGLCELEKLKQQVGLDNEQN